MPASMYATMRSSEMKPKMAAQVGTVTAKRRAQITRASSIGEHSGLCGATVGLRCLMRRWVQYAAASSRELPGQTDVPRKVSAKARKLHVIGVEKEQNTPIEIASSGPIDC